MIPCGLNSIYQKPYERDKELAGRMLLEISTERVHEFVLFTPQDVSKLFECPSHKI